MRWFLVLLLLTPRLALAQEEMGLVTGVLAAATVAVAIPSTDDDDNDDGGDDGE